MSEKRFKQLTSSIDYYDIWDTVEDKGYIAEDIVNKLYDENEQLKLQCKSKTLEIEQLKKCYRRVIDEMDTLAEITDKENEQLKSQIIQIVEKGLSEIFGDKYRIIEDIGEL